MNRICELRKKQGLTQKMLAEKLQIDQSAVSYWECGRAFPDTQKQILLADLFGVSIDFVLGRNVPEGAPPVSIPPQAQLTRQITVFGSITASSGITDNTSAVSVEYIPADWDGEYFAVRMKGDSMSPRYLDGDTVIIRRQSSCTNGQDAFILIGAQEGTLKKVFLDYNGNITLKPINQSYRTIFFSEREATTLPLVIYGIAVELRRTI